MDRKPDLLPSVDEQGLKLPAGSNPTAPSTPSVWMLVLFWGVLFGLYFLVCWVTAGLLAQKAVPVWVPMFGLPLLFSFIVDLLKRLSGETVTWSDMGIMFLWICLYSTVLMMFLPMFLIMGGASLFFSIFQPGIRV